MAILPSCGAFKGDKAPWKLPIGVRFAETTTISWSKRFWFLREVAIILSQLSLKVTIILMIKKN
jgi:hypothetical protein